MPKSQSDLLTEVRNRLDEATATFWTDPQLRRWINEGARNIARRAEVLLDRYDVPVTTGTQQYSAPDDVVRVHRAEWRPSGQDSVYPLEYKDYAGLDSVWWSSQQITQGYPAYFTMWGFPPSLTVVLYPKPSQNGVVRLYYYRLPQELVTDATTDQNKVVEVPEGWSDLIVSYAEFSALRKDGDSRWQEAKAMYEEQLAELIDNTRRWSDQAGSFEFNTVVLPGWLVHGDSLW